MTVFYIVMAGLVALTLLPSALYVVLYAATGEEGCARRARMLFNTGKVLALAAFNIGIWGNVVAALWNLWR